jgi:acyl transferase domain-containing protein
MDPVVDAFAAAVAEVPRHAPGLPVLSNVTGTWLTTEQATDPAYWARQIRATVRFGQCVATVLAADGVWAMVECGPGKQLAGLVRMQLPKGGTPPFPSLPAPGEKAAPLDVLYGAAGRLWTAGVALSDDSCGAPGYRVSLPTYPYERTYHWVDPVPADATPVAPPRTGPLPLDEWFSVPTWEQSVAPDPVEGPGRYLVLGEVPDVVAELRAAGADVVEVTDPAADLSAVLDGLRAEGGLPGRVVHAFTLSGTEDDVLAAQERGFLSLLAFVRALAVAGPDEPVHLDVLTRGTQDVTGHDVTRPQDATVAGIAKVVPLEMPSLTVRHVDLDPHGGARQARVVAAELRRTPGDRLVAVRGGRRWLPGHERVTLPPGADVLREGGVYLITGGLGGIGLTLAGELARRVRAKLVLVSRTGLPPREDWDAHAGGDRTARAIAAVRLAEQAGAEVLVAAADVTDEAALRGVREQAVARFGRLDGIVHAAGVAGGGMAEVKETDAALRVLAPKLRGTTALRAVFGDLDLDFVLLCSSVTAVAGGLGQVDYCAANSFLDAYAAAATDWATRVVAVDWGGWLEVGMAAETTAPAVLGGRGGTPMAHPILRTAHDTACEGVIAPDTDWVLGEHRITGVPVLPGSVYLEIARCAADRLLPGDGPVELRDVVFAEPLPVPDGTSARIRVDLDGDAFTVTSTVGDGAARVHARGSAARATTTPSTVDLAAVRSRCAARGVAQGMFDSGITPGAQGPALLGFGERWRCLESLHVGEGEELARLAAPGQVAAELVEWGLHPSLLDMALSFGTPGDEGAYLPIAYGRFVVHGPLPATAWSHVRYRDTGAAVVTADLSIVDDEGRELVTVSDLVLRRVDIGAMSQTVGDPARSAGAGGELGIRPAEGAEAFRRVLGTDTGPRVVVAVSPVEEILARTAGVTAESLRDAATEDLAEEATRPQRIAGSDFVPPANDLEAAIARLWGEVLGADRVGAQDDFFDLGGNSLVAVQLIAQVRAEFAVKVPMQTLFDGATVARMAAAVEGLRAAGSAAAPEAPRASGIKRLARNQ